MMAISYKINEAGYEESADTVMNYKSNGSDAGRHYSMLMHNVKDK